MRVILFGLTGLGNVVLEELLSKKVKILSVSTRQEKGNYPYFNCENIADLCKKHLIPFSYDKTFFDINCDLIISATYHKKINLEKSRYKLAINMHPSYLPHLKGKDPIKIALENNEQYLGLTSHLLTNIYDEGKILYRDQIYFDKLDTKRSIVNKLIPLFKNHINLIIQYYGKNYV
jgi:methionyl-tRNA formyltransferase